MCRDYYTLQFMDPSVDTAPIAPALAAYFDNVLDQSISQLNFKVTLQSFPKPHDDVLEASAPWMESTMVFRMLVYLAVLQVNLALLQGSITALKH